MDSRWFRRLQHILPPAFRSRFGEPMRDFYLQLLADAEPLSPIRRLLFTVRLVVDLLLTAGRAWSDCLVQRPQRQPEPPGSNPMDRFLQDVRYALRTYSKRPGFTAIIVITLALGIGANTAVFTLVNEIVLRPLPIGDPARVVDILAKVPGGNSFTGFGYSDYLDYRDHQDVLSGVTAYTGRQLRLGTGLDAQPVMAQFASLDYFDVIQIQPALGRVFRAADALIDGPTVAVISQRFWASRTGGDPDVLGSTLLLNGVPFTVIGIAPRGFDGTFIGYPSDIWLPMRATEIVLPNFVLEDGERKGFELMGRLAPGVSVPQAQAELDALAARLETAQPTRNKGARVEVLSTTGLDHSMRGSVLAFLAILMVVAGLVLLITCLNVGSLLLARATARRKEMSIRFALGAGAGRVARQLLTEVIVIFIAGGALGAFVAALLSDALATLVTALPMSLGLDLGIDWRVLLFTAVVALITSLVAGIFPAREAVRHDLVCSLRVGANSESRQAGLLRSVFVVTQIAAAVTLLVGAGLFLRSLQAGLSLDPGFEADRVAATSLVLPQAEYDDARGQRFYDDLLPRIARLRGVEAVATAHRPPIDVSKNPIEVEIPGYVPDVDRLDLIVDSNNISPGYLSTLQIPLSAGREFTRTDGPDAPRVAIVNETMAERFWPRESAIGKSFVTGGTTVQVVGVAHDSRTMIQNDLPAAYVYFPAAQDYSARQVLLVRTAGEPQSSWRQIRQEIAARSAIVPREFATLRGEIDLAFVPQRLAAAVTLGLGAFGLLLASLGIYGVLAHAVSHRTREIGIRVALGGRSEHVIALVVGQGLRLVASGLVLGVAIALALTPLLRSFLVGVEPSDPLTVVAVVLTLLGVASVAAFLPARRAARIDPTDALRFEA